MIYAIAIGAALVALWLVLRHKNRAPVPSNYTDPTAWEIGPIINGSNYSHGVPLHPVKTVDGWAIDIPSSDGVHYVTAPCASLEGKSRVSLHYRIEMADGVAIQPVTAPVGPSMLTLYFERAGDNWSGEGKYEAYRWFATFATQTPVTAGEHEITAPLDGEWTAVMTSSASGNPSGFADAKRNAARAGFVLGGGTGYGHGVFATGPARIVVTGFEIA